MKLSLSILLLSLSVHTKCFSQDKLLLQQFKFRTKNFKALEIKFGVSGQRIDTYDGFTKSGNVNAGFNTNYSAIKSTNTIYQTILASFGGSYTSGSNTSSSTNKFKTIAVLPSFNINNKWYNNNNYKQIIFGASSNLGLAKSESTGSINYKNTQNKQGVIGNITLGIGTGRLEIITYMQNALWLSKILLAEGNFNRALTNTEIDGLAIAITQANNFRVTDGRKRIQYILKTLDNYLQSKNLVANTNIEYFANLNDVVFFANNNDRQAGTEKFIKLTTNAGTTNKTDNEKLTPFNKTKQGGHAAQLTLKIGLQKNTPINLTKQLDYGITIKTIYGKSNYDIKDYTNNIPTTDQGLNNNWKKIGTELFLTYGIYPNTRTIIQFLANADNGYQYTNGSKTFFSNNQIAASSSYFINYRTRLNFNAGLNHKRKYYEITNESFLSNSFYFNNDDDNISLFLNIGLNIAF